MNQIGTFKDQLGVWQVNAGQRFSFRDSLAKALLYAHQAAMRGDAPTCILGVGTDKLLDAYAIEQGWRELNFATPSLKN